MLASLIGVQIEQASSQPSWTEIVPWGAFVAGIIALAVALWNQLQNRRDRRRTLYSEAYRAGLAWAELYYRVRRRCEGQQKEIVCMFHDAQEQIDYHQGWLSIESPSLGRAYKKFVRSVKETAQPKIQRAWQEDPVDPADGIAPESGDHLDVREAQEAFLQDVSDHLSPLPWRWAALRERYKEQREAS